MSPRFDVEALFGTIPARAARRLLAVLALLAFAALRVLAQDEGAPAHPGPFRDVPKGHWAFAAVERLAKDGLLPGYSDGTFKGRRIVTRYDLAVAVSRAVEEAERLRSERGKIPDEDQRLLERLTAELRNEMTLLGVRVESLEKRVIASEQATNELEARQSNIRIEGFYRLLETYVYRKMSYKEYPFIAELDPFRNFRDRGLQPLEQQIFLRLTGAPYLDTGLADNLEVFGELLGVLTGPRNLVPNYRLADPIFSGDTIDDFATGVIDEQRVSFNRAHFVAKAKRGVTRIFVNESATDLTDPSILFTVDRFAPYSGGEFAGSYKKLGYTGSVTKLRALTGSDLSDPDDVRRVFQPFNLVDTDLFTTRLTYEPTGYDQGNLGHMQLFGGTFVEQIFDYNTLFENNRVIAWDYQWGMHTHRRQWDSTFQWLLSDGRKDKNDTAAKLDSTYVFGNFLGTLKAYAYGHDFENLTGQFPFVDTDVYYNFKRELTPGVDLNGDGNVDPYEATRGERAARLMLKYHFPQGELPSLQDLTLSSLYEMKAWERDHKHPTINDEIPASRFQGQALADLTTRLHLELSTELEKDLPLDRNGDGLLDRREGKVLNTLRLDWRAASNLNLLGEMQIMDDLDSRQADGSLFKMKRNRLEASSQLTRDFFLKASTERIENSDLQLYGIPAKLVDGRDIDRQIAEAAYSFTDWGAFRVLVVFQDTQNRNFDFEDNFTRIYTGELDFNFSKTLKGRYVHGVQDTDLDNAGKLPVLKNLFIVNNYAELIYEPTEATELRLTYGNEYENPLDPLDNGPAKFFKTEKILQLKAQTQF
ncbi:MAG: S-layer homology domain-containing protein [Candidatus Riflebacteria bacterium]|nr:S-layer homology domain-containing protein [Candidatus Riflebacteria bacterium]